MTSSTRLVSLNGTAPSAMRKADLVALIQAAPEAQPSREAELAARVAELEAQLGAAQPKQAAETLLATHFKTGATLALGCGIPLLSLALSNVAGTLATSHPAIAVFAFALMAAVLAVSLPHLAWSVRDITRSGRRPSWCLAVALDLSIVLCETTSTFASQSGLAFVSYTVMVAVCVASMALNCWAFFRAPQHS